jgi:FtsP/CotA-like multicopper oxidase with cupredoxin domain
MITRKEVLRLGAAGTLGIAALRMSAIAAAGDAGAAPSAAGDEGRLTTAALRALAPLTPTDAIVKTGATRRYAFALQSGQVEPLPGHAVVLPTVNGMSPGPVLRAVEGDDVEISVTNRLSLPTTLHWHGVPVPFSMDGSPSISQKPIGPGETFTYRWTAPQAGTYMYHSHDRDMEQVSMSGMIVIDPANPGPVSYAQDIPIMIGSVPWEAARRAEAQAVLADAMLMPGMAESPKADPLPSMGDAMDRMDMVEYWCFNGKTYPATQPIDVKTGDVVRVRFGNLTGMTHPIHLHGHWFRWIAQDGNPLASPLIANTVAVQPGQTIDIDFIANNPGIWPLHCHILAHIMDNHDAMTGLMTLVRYAGFERS